jgi:uncharacterized repeat protein (TIGR03806 family)
LVGVYIYGDYGNGNIWALRSNGRNATEPTLIARTRLKITSFGEDEQGELYFTAFDGRVHRLRPAMASKPLPEFPVTLSQTGLFQSTKDHIPARGAISYSVNVPAWSDGATSERFIALPANRKIVFRNDGAWVLPIGAVVAQTVSIEKTPGIAQSLKRLETRLLVRSQRGWDGYTYAWNDDDSDATLVGPRGQRVTLAMNDSAVPSGVREQTWVIPGRNECMLCHARSAGFVLGLRTPQMNKEHDYGGSRLQQLRVLSDMSIFTKLLPQHPERLKAFPDPYDNTAALNARARAYLDVNCSVCHVPSGLGNATIDLIHPRRLEDTHLINELPLHGRFGLIDGRIVVPGDPYRSVLFYRLCKLGPGRMPHVGSNLIDEQGLELIHDWIVHLPVENGVSVKGNQADHPDYVATAGTMKSLEGSPPAKKTELLDQLLSSTRKAVIASRLVANEAAPPSVLQQIVEFAMTHADVNVRDIFEQFVPENRRSQRLGDVIDPAEILALRGDEERGRRAFFSGMASQCMSCHRVGEVGGTLGPDLSHIGKKYKRNELFESLVDPSKSVDPKYASYALLTTDGEILRGILVEKSDQHIVLNVLTDGSGENVRIKAEDVEQLMPQRKSQMPDFLLRELTAQQAADLLAFLVSLK